MLFFCWGYYFPKLLFPAIRHAVAKAESGLGMGMLASYPGPTTYPTGTYYSS